MPYVDRRIILKPSRYRDRTGTMPRGLVASIIRRGELRARAQKFWAFLRNYFKRAWIIETWANFMTERPELRDGLDGLLQQRSFYERSLYNRYLRFDYFANSVYQRADGWHNDPVIWYVAPTPGVPNLLGRAWD